MSEAVPSQAQIVATYKRLNDELAELQRRLFEVEDKAREHDLVIETLEPLPGERKCFRLIGGVLVERTVHQVLPTVKEHAAKLKASTQGYKDLLEKKQKELVAFMTKYKIQVKGDSASNDTASASAGQGVLVAS